jgi:hypothetical protein
MYIYICVRYSCVGWCVQTLLVEHNCFSHLRLEMAQMKVLISWKQVFSHIVFDLIQRNVSVVYPWHTEILAGVFIRSTTIAIVSYYKILHTVYVYNIQGHRFKSQIEQESLQG